MSNPIILPPSVKSLYLSFCYNSQVLSSGTGFVVEAKNRSYLITNRHNVTGRNNFNNECLHDKGAIPNEVDIWHNKKNSLGTWVKRKELLLTEDVENWIEHPTLGCEADFIALPLTNLDDVHLYPYELSNEVNEISLLPTDILRVVGFPFGMSSSGIGMVAIWMTGFVASEPDIDYMKLPVILIDCRARPGQSGSPVISHVNAGTMYREGDNVKTITKGSMTKFVGIYSGRIHKDSDIGIVWKRSAILELIDSISQK